MAIPNDSLAQVMASVARHLDEPAPVAEVLHRILLTAKDTVDRVDYAGISVIRRGGKIETAAATHPLVSELDELQSQLGEGPCLDALRGESQFRVDDVSTDPRWPNFGPKAGARGVSSLMGLELFSEDDTIGALNLYSDDVGVFDQDSHMIAQLFATHAAHAMGSAVRQEQLTNAVRTRTLIGQAMGIIMERYGVDEDRAFSFLKRTSQDGNIKLSAVASQLVERANQRTRARMPS